MGTLTLTETDQRRADVLTRLVAKTITTTRAAQLLSITDRQVRRLRIGFLDRGLCSIAHGNRGRPPAGTTSVQTKERIRDLTGPDGPYHDFNVCHLRDQLAQEHRITIGRSTLQRLLQRQRSASPAPERKPPPQRSRRLRSGAAGMMVQIDGSYHDWLEGRAGKMCLMGAIDDANNQVLYLRFCRTETAGGYQRLFRHIGVHYGLPMSYYHDKHTILRSPKKATKEDELAGREPMSHVQQLLHALGIESIAAHSPQAKGRIERLWQTLQDRLIKEMRLDGINTMDQANDFLEAFIQRHNARFAFEAMDPSDAWVALLKGSDLDYLFGIEDLRTVKPDHTISFEGATLQITTASRTRNLVGQVISVRTNAEGDIFLYDAKRRLEYKPIVNPAKAPKPITLKEISCPKTDKTPLNAKQRGFLFARP